MRSKTEAKLQQIVAAATRLFIGQGLDGTSMSEIAAAVGGSKATLYNYFPSKEKLFTEVMLQAAEKLKGRIFDVLDTPMPVKEKLQKFAKEYLAFLMSPEMLEIRRTILSEVHKLAVGPEIYERGIKKKWGHMATALEKAMNDGEIKKADPWTATMQFRALLEINMYDSNVFCRRPYIMNTEEIQQTVNDTVALFFSYYEIK